MLSAVGYGDAYGSEGGPSAEEKEALMELEADAYRQGIQGWASSVGQISIAPPPLQKSFDFSSSPPCFSSTLSRVKQPTPMPSDWNIIDRMAIDAAREGKESKKKGATEDSDSEDDLFTSILAGQSSEKRQIDLEARLNREIFGTHTESQTIAHLLGEAYDVLFPTRHASDPALYGDWNSSADYIRKGKAPGEGTPPPAGPPVQPGCHVFSASF
ncbi:hypothetical protein HK405_000776 [Cladochytrium tenue]|nr:hypothetical protein HK405_000776 [Cladochytrium tenue]